MAELTGRLERWLGAPRLVVAVVALSLFGVAMIYSAGQVEVPSAATGVWKRQALWLVFALCAFGVAFRIPARWYDWGALPAYGASVLLLAVTLVVGTGSGTAEGVKSWIRLGGFQFQPAEVAKIATIVFLARVLAARDEPPASLRELVAPVAVVGLPLGLVVLQPDLGTSIAFVAILFAVLYWAGTPLGLLAILASPGLGLILSFDARVWSVYIVLLLGLLYLYRLYLAETVAVIVANLAVGTVALPLWRSLAPYQRSRLLVFLDPAADPKGAGWHLIQSKVAIGSGGFLGKGFAMGSQKRYAFLPEQHTDFIFSVVGEELGFVGTMGALLLFGYVLWRLVKLAERAADPFAGLVVFGIFGAWLVHTVVNIGMTIGFVPITGIPLPFVSYGGSFLLMSYVAMGVAVSVATRE